MRRRDFIGLTAAGLMTAGAATLAAPTLVAARPLRLAVPEDDPALTTLAAALAAAFARETGLDRVEMLPAQDAHAALRIGSADAAVIPLESLEPIVPAAGILAGLPFGPGPDELAGWLAGRQGRRLWDRMADSAELGAIPLALDRTGRCACAAPPRCLLDVAGVPVQAPGPTADLWRRLGAGTGGTPTIRDGVAEGLRGFGPRTRPIALVTTPDSERRMGLTNSRLLRRMDRRGPILPRRADGDLDTALPAELFVAAGNALPELRAELLDHPDPLVRAIAAALLPLTETSATLPASTWPWPGAPGPADHRLS